MKWILNKTKRLPGLLFEAGDTYFGIFSDVAGNTVRSREEGVVSLPYGPLGLVGKATNAVMYDLPGGFYRRRKRISNPSNA